MRHILRLLLLGLLLSCASSTWAAIALDGTCTVSGGTGDWGDDTFSHTTSASVNFLTVCTHTHLGAGDVNTVAAITYNGDTVSPLVAIANGTNGRTEFWYRLSPDIGTFNVFVDVTANPYYVNVACGWSGVAQVAPTHTQTATATASTISAPVTSAVGEMVLSCATMVTQPVTITPGAGETGRWNSGHDFFTGFGASMDGAAGSVTPDLTFDTAYFASQLAVSFAPLAVAAGRRSVGPIMFP